LVQLTASGIDLRTTKICDVMHHPVLTISEQSLHNVFAAIFLFRRHRIRHLAIAQAFFDAVELNRRAAQRTAR
jgi:signal-transduction protein with cAMP-binding, CBS, and nucleotidyltransferase domain